MSRLPSHRRPHRSRGVWAVAAALAALVSACCAPPPPSGPPGDIVVETDAFVREATPFTNFGTTTQPPALLPTVECSRDLGGGAQEFVFGYESLAPLSFEVPLVDEFPEELPDGPTNELRRSGPGGTTVNEPAQQNVQFQPGVHPRQFSVRVEPGDSVEWVVVVPEASDNDWVAGYWVVTLRPKTTAPACGSDVPEHFAVVQAARAGLSYQGPDGTPPQPDRAPDGTITGYGIQVEYTATVACSDGATGSSFSTLIGWASDNAVVDPLLGTRQAVVPWGTIDYQLTTATFFPVVDILREAYTQWPSTDVTGICQYPTGTAESSPYWSDLLGGVFVTWLSGEFDNGDGTTTACQLVEPGCPPKFINDYAVAPGGSRWR